MYLNTLRAIGSLCIINEDYIKKGGLGQTEISQVQEKIIKMKSKIFTNVTTALEKMGEVTLLDDKSFTELCAKTEFEQIVRDRTAAQNEFESNAAMDEIDSIRPDLYFIDESPSEDEYSFSYRRKISIITGRCLGLESNVDWENIVTDSNDAADNAKVRFENAIKAEVLYLSGIKLKTIVSSMMEAVSSSAIGKKIAASCCIQ